MWKEVSSDSSMGGAAIDEILLQHFLKEFEQKSRQKITDSRSKAVRRLARECEFVKSQLSRAPTASVHVDALYEGIDFSASLTRARFESLLGLTIERCIGPVQDILEDSELQPSDIDAVCSRSLNYSWANCVISYCWWEVQLAFRDCRKHLMNYWT